MEAIIFLAFFIAVLIIVNKRTNGDLLADLPHDFRMLFTKRGRLLLRAGRRWLHFHYTGILCSAATSITYLIDHFALAPFQDQILLCFAVSFCGLLVNLVREGYYRETLAAEFDMRDVRFGFYGGLIYSLATVGIITLLLHNLI